MKSIAPILIVVVLLSGCSGEQETRQTTVMDLFEEGRTVTIGKNMSVFVEKKDGMTLRGLCIIKKNPDGSEEKLEAETAVVSNNPNQIAFMMSDVTVYSESSKQHYRRMSMQSTINIKLVKTIYECTKAIALNPNDADAHYNLAVAYEDIEQYKKAIVNYKKVIALTPRDAEAYCAIGRAYGKSGQHADAIAAYKKAIALKPDSASAYLFMGIAYDNLEQYPDAIAAFINATAVKADYANAYLFMGFTYEKLEQYPESIAVFKKYIALVPTGEYANDARKKISEIENRD
ncbi:MAG: tetratricopeptide repeat protein [Phycisphaerae bacterium]|jgi:tetratricopeptide (TPR) repeat protein|nr:tetratricopeptide repeat protein [Phycisphaerae bacterium]